MDRIIASPALRGLWLGLLALCYCAQAAETTTVVELEVAPKIRASAEYRPGSPQAPAVLLLHGFLQTRDSPVIYKLADALHAAGYTVLAPTLSLRIDLRRQSLDCDALHLHAMDEDVRELGTWVDWLAQRHPGPVVLLGHSSGAVQVLDYLSGSPSPAVSRAILLSLVYFGPASSGRETALDLEHARTRLDSGGEEIDVYHLSYCDKYPAPPAPYLSYLRWNRATVLEAIGRVHTPIEAMFGSVDGASPPGWPEAVAAAGARLEIVEGGDHFFRDFAEFELTDLVLRSLAAPTVPGS